MTTSFLGLSTFDDSSASSTTFSTFRNAIAGNNSNFTILDIFSSATSASITSLKTNTFTAISANQISTNYYEASAGNLTGYLTNMPINLKIDTNISGSASLNINGYGVKNLMKIDSSGCAVNLINGDIGINEYNTFIYNGSYWILVGRGVSSISGSGIMSTTAGSIVNHNVSGITSGSYNQVLIDAYGHATAGSVISNLITISGSGIMSNTTGSIVKHNISGITSGSYNTVLVDIYGHVTAGSIVTNTGTSSSGLLISGSAVNNAIVRLYGTSGSSAKSSGPTIDDTGNLSMNGNQIQNYAEKSSIITASATYNIDWATANLFEITMTTNIGITFSNLAGAKSITTLFIQDGSGSRTVTSWPSVKWSSGSAPLLTSSACAVDAITFFARSAGSTVLGFPAGMDMK